MLVNVKILFFPVDKQDRVIGNLITWWTKSKYYHVEIIVGATLISAYTKGVSVRNNVAPNEEYDTKELVVDVTPKQLHRLTMWLDKRKGDKYDFLGILLSTIFPTRIDDPNKWFCSELTTKVLQLLLEEKTYELTPNMVTPGDLAKLYGVEYHE